MVIPKIAVCPICGKKTYLRIEVGGYLNDYPIRVYCSNCRSLMKGIFVMNSVSASKGLCMFNAKLEECDFDPTSNKMRNADYVIDISGELLCKKVRNFDGDIIASTPFLEAVDQVNINERIDRLRYFISNMEEWRQWRSIAFQLLDEGSINYIATALHNKMGEFPYQCDNYLKSLHCLQEVVLEETRNLFFTPTQEETVSNLLIELSQLDRDCLHQLVDQIGGIEIIISSFRRIIDVIAAFMDLYPNILPAETFMRFRNTKQPDYGIATCSFGDIKTFYQDTYESLLSLLYIPVGIDNILLRGNHSSFSNAFNQLFKKDWYAKLPDNFARYMALDNGMKLEKIQTSDPMQQSLNIPADRSLRNGIGHNSVEYDGLTQMITYSYIKDRKTIRLEKSLMEMAIDCIGLAKSSVVLAEIMLFILRQKLRKENMKSIIHPRFYKKAEPNSKCPCGSNIKFKKCCRSDIESLKYHSLKQSK